MIRGHNTKVVLGEAIVVHSSEAMALRVGTLCVSLISIMDNLTGSFMPLFISPMEDSLVLMIILARVVVSL